MNKLKFTLLILLPALLILVLRIFVGKGSNEPTKEQIKDQPEQTVTCPKETTMVDTTSQPILTTVSKPANTNTDKHKTNTAPAAGIKPTNKSVQPEKKQIVPAPVLEEATPEKDTVFSEDDAEDLDRLLDNASRASKASASRTGAIPDLEEQIATFEEKIVVQTWQQTTIEKQEKKKSEDWAGYHQSVENKISGLWQMGDSGAIAFYKDGTGQVSFIRDDKKEQTLTGNFFFRYSVEGNIVEIIPILTKNSNRRITANFVIKVDGNKLFVGPYSYTSMGKRK